MEPEDYNEDDDSGAGIEFALETKAAGDWAIIVLQNMLAYDMMLSTGQMGDRSPIGLHHRIPLNSPIDGKPDTVVRNLVTCEPVNFPDRFGLPSGKVSVMQFVGITDQERDYAREQGMEKLADVMIAADCYPVTVPDRKSSV